MLYLNCCVISVVIHN